MREGLIPTDRAKAILARAASLEAQFTGLMSLDEVRDIGREAGIDAEALERAIAEEYQSAPAVLRRPGFRWPLVALLTGAGLGAGSAYVLQGSFIFLSVMAGVGGMAMASGMLAGLLAGASAHRRFQLSNLSMWVGFIAVRVQLNTHDGAYFVTDMIRIGAIAAVVTGFIGAALIAIKQRSARVPSGDEGGTPKGIRGVAARLTGAAKGIWYHLNTPVWRSPKTAGCSHAG